MSFLNCAGATTYWQLQSDAASKTIGECNETLLNLTKSADDLSTKIEKAKSALKEQYGDDNTSYELAAAQIDEIYKPETDLNNQKEYEINIKTQKAQVQETMAKKELENLKSELGDAISSEFKNPFI